MNPSYMVEDLHDAFQFVPGRITPVRKLASALLGRIAVSSLRARRRILESRLTVNERIVEYPTVWKWIRSEGTVLDFGCATSRLPLQLAGMGYKVHGIDLRPYQFSHRDFSFHQADITDWEPVKRFDIVLCISTLEHVGLGAYDGDRVHRSADALVIERLRRMMNPGGQLICSVPFGLAGVYETYRVYDLNQLESLFGEFKCEDKAFFRRKGRDWYRCGSDELVSVPSPAIPVNGVAIFNLTMPA